MHYDIVRVINELDATAPVRVTSGTFFDDFDSSARIQEVKGEHVISSEVSKIYTKRLAAKGEESVGGQSLKYAASSFESRLGGRVRIWLVETTRFVGYVFIDTADNQIIAAPFGSPVQRSKSLIGPFLNS